MVWMRKKIILAVFLFFVSSTLAFAQDTGWVVEKFHSDIIISQDAQVTVVETVEANFGNLQKHGIYRVIPVKYKTKFRSKRLSSSYYPSQNRMGSTGALSKKIRGKICSLL